MEIVFLGTSAGMPSKFRHTSSLLINLVDERGTYWLVDCGEAMQHQLMKTNFKPRRVEKIFITHLHGDHIYGLPGFLGSRSFLGGTERLTIYGPAGIKEYVQTSLRISRTHLTYPLDIIEIVPGQIMDDDTFTIYADTLNHVVPCFGYRFEQKDLAGALHAEKARLLGVPKGPDLAALKNGQDVQLASGLIVKSKDVTDPPRRGFILTVLGDTQYTQNSIQLAYQADILVHEATFDSASQHLAKEYGHSTFADAARVAKQAEARHLIVNHISARFTKDDEPRLSNEMTDSGCPSYIAEDFKGFRLTRQWTIESFNS